MTAQKMYRATFFRPGATVVPTEDPLGPVVDGGPRGGFVTGIWWQVEFPADPTPADEGAWERARATRLHDGDRVQLVFPLITGESKLTRNLLHALD